MSTPKNVRFYQLLEQQLNTNIKPFIGTPLDPGTLRRIRETIRQTIHGVFSKSKHGLSEHATTWLTDQYFKGMQIGDDQTMNDMVVLNEYKLPELEFNDIRLLRDLFLETQLGQELDDELRRRTMS